MFRQIELTTGSFPFQIGIHNSHLVLLSPSWCLFPVECKNCLQSHHNHHFGFLSTIMSNWLIFPSWFFYAGPYVPYWSLILFFIPFGTLFHLSLFITTYLLLYSFSLIYYYSYYSLLLYYLSFLLFFFIFSFFSSFLCLFLSFIYFYLFHIFLLFIVFFSSYSYLFVYFSLFLLIISLLLLFFCYFFVYVYFHSYHTIIQPPPFYIKADLGVK
jgi:hypothetical protein